MSEAKTPEGFSLRRWSRRKLEATHDARPAEPEAPPAGAPLAAPPSPNVGGLPPVAAEPALPPVESLNTESDFAVFMQPKVEEALKRQALKKLFADPRFNVMDGLDVYIDDYTKSDPIPPSVLERLTRMGFVRDAGASAEAPPASAPAPAAETGAETGAAPPVTTIEPTRIEAAPDRTSPPSAADEGIPDASGGLDPSATPRTR